MAQTNCSNCGSPLPTNAQFCPTCGFEVIAPVHSIGSARPPGAIVPPPGAAGPIPVETIRAQQQWVPAEPDNSRRWVIAASVLVALVFIGVLYFIFSPGSDQQLERRTVETATIGEGQAPASRPSLVAEEPVAASSTAAPPASSGGSGSAPSTSDPASKPVDNSQPGGSATPLGTPQPAPEPGTVRISQDDAVAIVKSAAMGAYGDVASDCMDVRNEGFVNVGYTMMVLDRCSGGSELGRWRVDANTGDVFRQQPDGRYLRP
jgi:hypothetical protein